MKRYEDLVVVLFLAAAECSCSEYRYCPESCKKALGLESGIVGNDQLTAFSAYQNDFTTFGAHRARLNLKDWPPGYRASPVESSKLPWLRVDLRKDLVITGIATQGYGNASVAEWVTSYRLMFAKGAEFRNFVDVNGDVLNFVGNQDSDTIRLNEIRVPVVASSVILVPSAWHNNIGLRMELYGCEPEYYFVAWLMLDQIPFSLNYLNKTTVEYTSSALQATNEVHSYLNSVAGYLFSKLLRFSPQQSPEISTFVTAEIAIYCTEESVHELITKLKALISTESTAFASSYLKIQYPLACECPPPTVNLELNDYLSIAEVVNTSDSSYYLRTHVTSNCSTSTQSKFKWMISKIDQETGYFSPFLRHGPPNRNVIKLYPRILGTGYFYISVEAWVPDVQGTIVYDFGFLQIRRPALVAKVVGPTVVSRGIGNITLDGSQSYDPTTKRFPYRGLQFTWFCHRKCLRHQIYSYLLSESEVEGCFGPSSQIGESFSTERSISLNADQMESNCTYTFQFSVAKFDRITRITHVLQVKPAVLFYIRCITNCKKKVSPKRLLSLQLFCIYPSCLSNVTFTIYSRIIGDHVNEWSELKNISGTVQLELNGTLLHIPRLDALIYIQEGMLFQVRFKGFVRKGLEEQVFYLFSVNAPPISTTAETGCKVEPKEGSAILTDFYIDCLGFYDTDTPIRYAFKYTFSHSMIIIQDGTVGNVTTKLPLGDRSKDYERVLQLQIIDAYGEFSTVLITIKVRPPLASEALLGLIRAARDEMKLLVEANDVNKAADMAITVLSVVDANENLQQDETFKDSVLDVMTGVKIERLSLVTKVAVIAAYSTKRLNQSLPQGSQEDGLTLLKKTTHFVATLENSKMKELNVSKDINVNLITGIGNVIVSSARDSRVEAIQIGAKINKEKSKNITKSGVELIKVIKDKLVAEEGACSQPTVINTMHINLSACAERAFDIKAHKLLKGESAVMLPNARDLFPGQPFDENTVIDIKVVSYKENPYTWHNSSRIIKSSVLDIDLRNLTSGKPLSISGLDKPVEMLIKNERRELEETLQNVKPQLEFFVKPSSPGSIENMRYHRISMPYKDVEATIRIIPSNNVKLEVYIRYGVRPTPAQSNFQTVVPNTTTCLNNTETVGFFNCLSDPYAFTISPNVTGTVGLHFLGIRYVAEPPERVNKRRRRRSKRSCLDIGGRQKRSCVEVKSPPSIHAATSDFKNGSDVKYSLFITMGACMYWSEESEEWTSQGCKVGSQATPSKLQCMCTHLTSFGGDLFVAPNPIDFEKVLVEFGQLGKTGNFVVLTFICVVFGLYFIGLVLARMVDRRDISKVAPNVHIRTEADCKHVYEISIQSGIWRGCGTTASVAIILFGENGSTPPITLSQKHLQQRFFARGSVNTFTIHLAESLGSLFKIKIWHDNSGTSPAWFFHQVLITEPETQEKWYFLGNRWLALEKGNGKISAEIKAAGYEEYLAFRNLFHFRGAKTLGEKHLWLSLFTKAPHSTFTRCQRLSCCLSILMATMVTNAMFYKQGLKPEDTFKVGPIELSWTQIKIGLQSGLVAIPVNVLVVAIFRNIKPERSEDNLLQSDEDSNRTGCCPRFCVYIGWVLCIMTSLVSAAFVVFYSLMWGKEVANQWLASVMISFFQDVIVIQPVKVGLLVSLLSLIVKKPIENDEIHGQAQSNQIFDKKITSYPPKDEELHQIRIARMMKTRMVKLIIEIAVIILFIILLVIVCYGNRKSTRYELTDAVRKLFAGFHKVKSTDSFWRWTKQTLLPGLFEVKWYNGRPFSYKEGFIANREAFMLGMPRLRQQRIKPDSFCQISDREPQLAKKFSRCIPHFSHGSEDKTKYHMPGWIPIYNLTVFKSHFEKLFLCPRPWRYETAKELQTLSFQGLISVYSGGGFVADLGYNTDDALQVIYSLEENGWIDNATAAVFIEFIIYEPTSSLFSSVKFVFERLANGDTNAITRIKTLTIYSPQDPRLRGFYETCRLFFMLLVLLCVACELVNIYKRGCAFFKDLWSWMEILLLSSSTLSVATFFLKEAYTSKFIAKVKKNPFQSWSVDEIELWSDLEVTLLSFVVFLVTMKLLRIIRFNPHIIQMRLTLRIVARHFPSFTMVFFTVIIAYVQFTTLTFGRSVYEYRSFVRSISSILLMLVGAKAPFHKLQAVSMVLGPFFVFAYMISIVMILLNMFLAILNDSHTESRRFGIEGLEDLEFSRLFKQKAKQVTHQVRVIVSKSIQGFPRRLNQGLPGSAMAFKREEGMAFLCENKDENHDINEGSRFTGDGESSLNNVIKLLGDIKEDLTPSIVSLDDIVPIVTIDDTDKRWCESLESLEGWKRYSSSSLFGTESDSALSKSSYLRNRAQDEKAVIGDFLLSESCNRRNALQRETFV